MSGQKRSGRRVERPEKTGGHGGAGALEARVLAFMGENRMADGGGCVLAAVSGGADSVCLLVMLDRLKERLAVRLSAFHLNHGLRGDEADRDEAFVRGLCGRLGIPCAVERESVRDYAARRKISEEEAGRELRYSRLEAEAKRLGGAKIAVAHHRDDDAETVLYHLFRGSGLRGVAGIRPVRGNVIRPLLCLSREEIAGYLEETGYGWCEDSTNAESRYARNKIRNDILPLVEREINSRAAGHICAFAGLAREADEYFEALAERILLEQGYGEQTLMAAGPGDRRAGGGFAERGDLAERGDFAERGGFAEPGCAAGPRAPAPRSASLPTAVFDVQPRLVRAYLVRALIGRAAGDGRDITERHIDAVLSLSGPGGGREVSLPWGLKAVRGYDRLSVIPAKGGISPVSGAEAMGGKTPRVRETELDFLDLPVKFRIFLCEKGLEIPKKRYTKWFDYDKIKGTPRVRARRSGDFLVLSGGGRKTLRRYMIDEKIPAEERGRIPLLADEEQVIWVIGYRISEYYKITDLTENILEVQVCKGEEDG